MITTLLFDLDDTLLGNDMGTFVPAYVEQLTRSLPAEVNAQRFITELITGTRRAMANRDPARNLLAVFNDYFYPAMGWDGAEWASRFDEFYRTRYSQLRGLTQRLPVARAVMTWAFDAGYEVVIATSPLFPLVGLQERLRWAGLADFPYARITSLENSHFSKPHPEYFAEILAHLGRRPEEALMIGNDWGNDILPTARLGMANYWIAPPGSVPPDGIRSPHPFGIGNLEMFWEWAKSTLPVLALPPPPASALPALLSGNLAAVLGTLEGVTAAEWKQRPSSAEWSCTEIVCHLQDVDREVNLPRLRTVVETDNPFISGADTDPWAAEHDYQSQSGPQALLGFAAARKEICASLADQPASTWNRTARHALFGPTHLAEIVGWILDHDRIHLEQLRKTRAKMSM